MDSSEYNSVRKKFEQGVAGTRNVEDANLSSKTTPFSTSPRSTISRHLQSHLVDASKAKADGLMIASERRTFGVAKKGCPDSDGANSVSYHTLGKEKQEQAAGIASQAALAAVFKKKDVPFSHSLAKEAGSRPSPPSKPTILPKPGISTVKPFVSSSLSPVKKTGSIAVDVSPSSERRTGPVASPRTPRSGEESKPAVSAKPGVFPKPSNRNKKAEPVPSSEENTPANPAATATAVSNSSPVRSRKPVALPKPDVPTKPSGVSDKEAVEAAVSNGRKMGPVGVRSTKPTWAPPPPPVSPTSPSSSFESSENADIVVMRSANSGRHVLHRLTTVDDQSPLTSPMLGKRDPGVLLEAGDSDDEFDSDEGEDEDSDMILNEENIVTLKLDATKERTESTLTDTVELTDKEKTAKKLFKIAEEIFTTEKRYVASLELLVQSFRESVLEMNRSSAKPLIPDQEVVKIFSNLPEIYQLNSELLGNLEKRIANWEELTQIGDVMARFAPFLKMYAAYTAQFEEAMKALDEWRRKESRFATLLKEFQAKPECRNLAISHFMLEPVQRIPRYKLLLQDYLKRLPGDAPDRPDTEKALNSITEAADKANNRMKELEEFEKLMEVQRCLADNLSLIVPGRIFLKEGFLNKCSRRGFDRRKFFLFNDILLHCWSMPAGFKVKQKICLSSIKVQIPVVSDVPHAFSVISRQEKSFMVSASSQEDRDDWFQTLSAAIKEQDKKLQSLKRQSSLLCSTDSVGVEAPVWLPDKSASMCMECGKPFTTLRRRHHCRGCGRILCTDCSRNKAFLTFLKREDRVCDVCYYKLKGLWPGHVLETDSGKRSTGVKDIKAHTEDAQKMGYLYVKKGVKGNWVRQWFQLKDDVLYSFKAHEDVKALATTPLLGYCIEPVAKGTIKDKEFVIKVGHQSEILSLLLEAESEEEFAKWLEVLIAASSLK
eukprot:m.47459 g.47459  ORF g.47459 m.47459 type:complete len:943 (+) comp33789_c0_seq1:49-2877(+)